MRGEDGWVRLMSETTNASCCDCRRETRQHGMNGWMGRADDGVALRGQNSSLLCVFFFLVMCTCMDMTTAFPVYRRIHKDFFSHLHSILLRHEFETLSMFC